MAALKLTQIGNSLGVILPKEVLARLQVGRGDSIFLTESPDGYRVTPYSPEFDRQMTVARGVMRRHRDALRELAK